MMVQLAEEGRNLSCTPPTPWGMISVAALGGYNTSLKYPGLCLQKSPRAQVLLLINQRRLDWVGPVAAAISSKTHSDFGADERPSPPLSSSKACHQVQNLCDQGQLDRALDVLLGTEIVPTLSMYRSVLQACCKRKALIHAKRVQSHLAQHGLEFNVFLGESLVNTLVKCGGLADALHVFHRLPYRTVFSWTAVIFGYNMSGQAHQALKTYQRMQEEGVEPNTYTFVSLLKACGSILDLDEGKRIHSEAVKYGCLSDLLVATSVVDMYAKCRSIVDAQNVFDGICQRDVASWNAMISAYASSEQVEMALELYEQMLDAGTSPDVRTFVSMLQACCLFVTEEEHVAERQMTRLESLQMGKELHSEAWMRGYEADNFLGSTLISSYSKCGSLVEAQKVFDGLSQQNVVSWNAMLAAYAQQSQPAKALQLYEQMLKEGVSPDNWTFVPLLQACGSLAEEEDLVDVHTKKFKSVNKGKTVHANTLKKGFHLDVFVGNSLISMYGKCGSIPDAQIVFDGLFQRNVVSWTAMLAAFAQQDQGEKAMQLYQKMLEEGISPNNQTFVTALQSCPMSAEQEDVVDSQLMKVQALQNGKAIHANAWITGHKTNLFIGHTLISMYGKCGSILDAETVFDGLSRRNVVAWNAMLAAYAYQGQAEKVWRLYNKMLKIGVRANDVTLLCILQVCNNTGSLETCKEIHHKLVSTGHINLPLASSLIHSYSRCASMEDAQNVFDAVPNPDVVAWTALIAGYAQQGNSTASLHYFDKMRLARIKPDGVTFLSLLSACSHAGLVDRGIDYFTSMGQKYHIAPEIEHYIGVVDLLGRAGYFTNLIDLVSTMPMQPNLSLWLCLLGSCRKHHKIELGKVAFDRAVRLQPENAAAYVLMSNIYAHAGLWKCVKELHELRQAGRAWKKPTHTWIEHDRLAHTFEVGDCRHMLHDQLYDLLGDVSLVLNEEGNIQHSSADVLTNRSSSPTLWGNAIA